MKCFGHGHGKWIDQLLFIQTNATTAKKSIVVGLKSEKSNEVEHVLLEDLMAAL